MDLEFEFKITGEGVSPGSVAARDLLGALQHLEHAVALASGTKHAASDPVLSLVRVEPGSARYRFGLTRFGALALGLLSSAIFTGDYRTVRREAHDHLHRLSEQAISHHCQYEIDPLSVEGAVAVVISEDRPVPSVETRPHAEGETTIYCVVNSVGGPQKHSADVRVLGGGQLHVALADEKMARKLGSKLFTEVGLEGDAVWDASGESVPWELLRFSAKRILPFEPTGIADAVRALAEGAGSSWDDVDPDEYVRRLRYGGI